MKIVELKIDDSIPRLAASTAACGQSLYVISAIETLLNAIKFSSMAGDSTNAVASNPEIIELNEKNNMKCATQVGKVRAQQLVNGEKLSLDTIKRMRSFLIRQKGNFELATRRKDYNACGYISYLLWGYDRDWETNAYA